MAFTPAVTAYCFVFDLSGVGGLLIKFGQIHVLEFEERAAVRILPQVLGIHLDNVRRVLRSDLGSKFVPVSGPVAIFTLDRDVGVLGLEACQ